MNYNIRVITASEQEKELNSILLRSSLYQDMAPEDKRELLNYLVTSYFDVLPDWKQSGPSHGYSTRTNDLSRPHSFLSSGDEGIQSP